MTTTTDEARQRVTKKLSPEKVQEYVSFLELQVRTAEGQVAALQQQVEQLQRQNRDAWQKAYALAFQVEQLEQQVERLETDLQDYRHLEADLKAFIESRPPPKKPAQPRPDFIGEQPENSEP